MSELNNAAINAILNTIPAERFSTLHDKLGMEFEIDGNKKEINMFVGGYSDVDIKPTESSISPAEEIIDMIYSCDR